MGPWLWLPAFLRPLPTGECTDSGGRRRCSTAAAGKGPTSGTYRQTSEKQSWSGSPEPGARAPPRPIPHCRLRGGEGHGEWLGAGVLDATLLFASLWMVLGTYTCKSSESAWGPSCRGRGGECLDGKAKGTIPSETATPVGREPRAAPFPSQPSL